MTYGEQTGRSRARRAIPLILAIVVGLVLVLVVRALVTGGGDDGAQQRADGSGQRTGCTALHVTASSEKAALLSRIAADYNRSGRTGRRHLRRRAGHLQGLRRRHGGARPRLE